MSPSFDELAPRPETQARRGTPGRRGGLGIGNLAVLIVVAMALILSSGCSSSNHNTKQALGPQGTQTYGKLSRNHTTAAVSYPQTPPVGGDHDPTWQNCGFYSQPIPSGRGVHSMEHGAVWITHRPGLGETDVKRLQGLAGEYVLVSPFENLPSPVVATAWGRQLRLDSVQDPRLDSFVQDFRRGPQTPEPGAPCTGGSGTPG